MLTIERLLTERPTFHRGETEIDRSFQATESYLRPAITKQCASSGNVCYGLEPEVLRFLAGSASSNSKTLETGAGLSTLVFALRRTTHTAITPSELENQFNPRLRCGQRHQPRFYPLRLPGI